jgi:hypothetical protein
LKTKFDISAIKEFVESIMIKYISFIIYAGKVVDEIFMLMYRISLLKSDVFIDKFKKLNKKIWIKEATDSNLA